MIAFTGACRAEWRKLATVRSTWAATFLAVALSLVVAGMGAWGVRIMHGTARDAGAAAGVGPLVGGVGSGASLAATGLLQLGLLILMILPVLAVTAEYSAGTIAPTTLATPRRWIVVVAKAVVCGLWSAATAAIALAACLAAVAALLPAEVSGGVGAVAADAPAAFGAVALLAFACAVLCVGAGFVLRSSPAAVAAVLLWRVVVEPLAPALPRVGDAVAPWLPFAGAVRWAAHAAGGGPSATPPPWPAPWAGIAWFVVVAVAVLGCGAVAYGRRPASAGE